MTDAWIFLWRMIRCPISYSLIEGTAGSKRLGWNLVSPMTKEAAHARAWESIQPITIRMAGWTFLSLTWITKDIPSTTTAMMSHSRMRRRLPVLERQQFG